MNAPTTFTLQPNKGLISSLPGSNWLPRSKHDRICFLRFSSILFSTTQDPLIFLSKGVRPEVLGIYAVRLVPRFFSIEKEKVEATYVDWWSSAHSPMTVRICVKFFRTPDGSNNGRNPKKRSLMIKSTLVVKIKIGFESVTVDKKTGEKFTYIVYHG